MDTRVNAHTARANMHTERNHKIVVGVVVALIAAAGIGSVIVNANRHGVVKHAAGSAAPTAAFPDQLAPQPGQAAQATSAPENPPPVSDSPLPRAASEQPGATAPPAATTPPAASLGPQQSEQGPAGESAVVTVSSKLASDSNSTATAFGNGRLAASDGSAQVPSVQQARASGADGANADRQITSAVQSQIAADRTTQRAALGVTTINGIVILTGTVPAPNVVEHVKDVVQQLQDVRGVDATAVKVSAI